jgi:hypothetical protein
MITLVVLALDIGPASANEYGNPDYLGIVKADPPQGFPVSPAFLDLGKGPVSVTFSVQATNLTSSDQSTPIGFSLHHILTFKGQDVSDGQPGQPGISFPPGNVALVTEELYGARQTAPLNVPASGQGTVSFTQAISDCGYYEIDFSTPQPPYTYLAVGFTRALGCNSVATTTTLPGTTTTTASVLASTTTSVPATTTSLQVLATQVSTPPAGQLPVTGSDSAVLVGMAGLLLLVGGALTAATARSPKRT